MKAVSLVVNLAVWLAHLLVVAMAAQTVASKVDTSAGMMVYDLAEWLVY